MDNILQDFEDNEMEKFFVKRLSDWQQHDEYILLINFWMWIILYESVPTTISS